MRAACVLFLALVACQDTLAKRILVVPCPVTSHILEANSLVNGLLEKGHEVYFIVEKNFPKMHVISSGIKKLYFTPAPGALTTDVLIAKVFEKNMKEIALQAGKQLLSDCEMILYDKELMDTMRNLNFDMALADGFPLSFCPTLIPYVLKVPFVFWFSSINPYVMRVPALPSFFSFATSPFHFSDKMTFFQRFANLINFVFAEVYHPMPSQKNLSLLQNYAPEISNWNELARKAVLFVETRDHLLEWPAPSMPNVIRTPGITVNPPKQLSQEFRAITDTAADGFILVSFGSIAPNMPWKITEKLITVFNKIEIPIIWRFSGDVFDTVRKMVNSNVHLFKWLPQNDLLGSSNIKLFITHCGNNGQHEALYHGVPMVGLPMFAEQFHNALRIMDHGFGVSLLPGGLLTMEVEELLAAIEKVLQNQSYKRAIMKRSKILKDNPMSPTETVTYWLEHVMEFGGDHLRSHGMDMPWYSYYMFDVFALVTLCFFILSYLSIKCLSRFCCKRKLKKE